MSSSSTNRVDGLLNEYKGNLFEFLVCKSFAQKFNIENHFYSSLNESLLSILQQQETFLRENFKNLLVELPMLADQLVSRFCSQFSVDKLSQVLLIGKSNTSGFISDAAEGDILLIKNDDVLYNVSLKLSKHNVFVNTKSAGIKTFYSKYFQVEGVEEFQQRFNEFIDVEFETLAIKMHSVADIPYAKLFTQWEIAGLPVLPGQLSGEYKECLLEYYSQVTQRLYQDLLSMYESGPIEFSKSLLPLLGFSSSKVIQAQANYKGEVDKFITTSIDIHECPAQLDIENIVYKNRVIDIILQDRVLQIRLKPMNKFTNSAYKVNCSVKFI